MADVATDLKQRFDWAMDVCLEAYEVLPDGRSFERSDDDELAIEIFKRLHRTADAIPSSLIASAEQLRGVEPELFEKQLTQTIGAVGSSFSPANAAEFLDEVLAKRNDPSWAVLDGQRSTTVSLKCVSPSQPPQFSFIGAGEPGF